MHLVYVDESVDQQGVVYSALVIPADKWQACFLNLREFRRDLKQRFGMFVRKELHAVNFVAGRGNVSTRIVPKGLRIQIYREILQSISKLPGAFCFNACFPASNCKFAFERLINRVNRTMEAKRSHAMMICDQGKEGEITRLIRKMGVYNPIPSKYGVWRDHGSMTQNIPIERIIEDPVFKDSSKSFFIQSVDFITYSLLRREYPLGPTLRYAASDAFNVLRPILFTGATRNDPEGILRP